MAFDISRLTNAVNKYLNSISDVANAAKTASQEIDARTRFATDLKDAISQNIQSKMRDQAVIPDIASQVKEQVAQATGAIDGQMKQINGSFEAIREAGAVSSAGKSGNSKEDATASSNYDAYKGTLSTEALQELSRSQYFSANLIQSSLFDVLDQDENGTSSGSKSSSAAGTSAFDTLSLSDINTNSLLQSSGLTNGSTSSSLLADALSSLTSTGASSETANDAVTTAATSQASSGDLARALIKAYTANGSNLSATSIFGDFTL